MASDNSSSTNGASKGRFHSRALRRASFISPLTGERSKRVFTLREASHRPNDHEESETTPLLNGNSGNGPFVAETRLSVLKERSQQYVRDFWTFAKSNNGRGIFKCSLAYLLGSLVTLIPAFAKVFGANQPVSKHMVATVSVWFHPARTIGSMFEAIVLAIIGFLYASVISFSSMGISVLLGNYDLLVVAHVIVLIVFVGGGMYGLRKM